MCITCASDARTLATPAVATKTPTLNEITKCKVKLSVYDFAVFLFITLACFSMRIEIIVFLFYELTRETNVINREKDFKICVKFLCINIRILYQICEIMLLFLTR